MNNTLTRSAVILGSIPVIALILFKTGAVTATTIATGAAAPGVAIGVSLALAGLTVGLVCCAIVLDNYDN